MDMKREGGCRFLSSSQSQGLVLIYLPACGSPNMKASSLQSRENVYLTVILFEF